MKIWTSPVEQRRPPLGGIAASMLFHLAAFGAVATITIPPVVRPWKAPRAAGFSEIFIDKKLYYITPLSTAAARSNRPKASNPEQAPAPQQPQVAKAEPAPAPEPRTPKVAAPFIPPEIRRETPRKDILVQADLQTVNVSPDAQLPTFQAYTGRLAPYRRDFIVPGQTSKAAARTVDLQTEIPVNPVIATSAVSINEPKLKLAAPPPVEEDLPALEVPNTAAQNGNPVNIISATNRATPPPRILVPPDNVAPKTEKNGPGTESESRTASTAKGNGSGPGGSGSGSASSTSSTRGVQSPDTTAVRTEAPKPDASKEAASSKPTVAADGFITRSPQGKFDSVVVQSSPLDQFPSGNTLLKGRPIYTVFVSVGGAKDWAMYFSVPTDSTSGATQPKAVDPPYPYRLLRPKVTIPTFQKYVLVHGFISETGALQSLQLASPASKPIADAVISAVTQWTIRPASRQGAPVAVEFVIAVPAGTY